MAKIKKAKGAKAEKSIGPKKIQKLNLKDLMSRRKWEEEKKKESVKSDKRAK